MKIFCALSLLLVSVAPLRAGEIALYGLPKAQVEYEGTGHRQYASGWELKVKPETPAAGLRWRQPLTEKLSLQAQYWLNRPAFNREDGNSQSTSLRQTGQTRLAVQNFVVDLRRPLEGTPVEVVAGLQGACETFTRRDIVFNGAAETGRPVERLWGAGAVIGLHGGRAGRLYYDWEALLGHLFFTGNSQEINGGSIHRDGYTYLLRLEGGVRLKDWRLGAGFVRQLLQIQAPGGKSLPSGATTSFPINKTDFFSPFIAVTYDY